MEEGGGNVIYIYDDLEMIVIDVYICPLSKKKSIIPSVL